MMFRGELYSQMDGVSMSSPIASMPAENCMYWILDQTFNKGSKSNSTNTNQKYQTKPSKRRDVFMYLFHETILSALLCFLFLCM